MTVAYLYANATVDGFMLALINRKQQIFDKACDGLADPDYLLRLSKVKRRALIPSDFRPKGEEEIVKGARP